MIDVRIRTTARRSWRRPYEFVSTFHHQSLTFYQDYKTQKDAVLFAIDVSSSMLQQPTPTGSKKADKDSAIAAALKCTYQFMQQRIIAQPKDMMGLLLFGTEKSKFRDEAGGRSGSGY